MHCSTDSEYRPYPDPSAQLLPSPCTQSILYDLACSLLFSQGPGLHLSGGIQSAAHQFSHLQNGLRFMVTVLVHRKADGESTTDLVLRCSDAMESLAIRRHPPGAFPPVPMTGRYLIATCGHNHVWGRLRSTSPSPRLKRVTFRFGRQTTQWTTMVLKIVKSENSQLITIHSPATFQIPLVNTVHQE